MDIVELDDRGRLTLPSEVRKSLTIGDRALLLNAGDHVKPIPLPTAYHENINGILDIDKPLKQISEEAEK